MRRAGGLVLVLMLTGCASGWAVPREYRETPQAYAWGDGEAPDPVEYAKFVVGTGVVEGQAFLRQRGGGVVYGAGAEVTLDPVTAYSSRWWGCVENAQCVGEVGGMDVLMRRYRRVTVADGDGRYRFEGVGAGAYYVRAFVRWDVQASGRGTWRQGGAVTARVQVEEGKVTQGMLTWR